ncbi:hypothetical protein N2599_36585 (plasmid) [Rhizobium sullae]|uniref:MarR family transcriptional regulator n=1 Tax=Rhizobium sullae TaxID=50338 RepID=A0ABY5Y0G8_RHISU|nr:hypothetical protein [Rhizobium sullae]UWU19553.1 hypothetical protein N2599_36585 [Rhizobium sullae]
MSGKIDREGTEPGAAATALRRSSHPVQLGAFATMTLNQIFGNPLKGESPSARMKQVSVMLVVGQLHGDGKPISLTPLIEITGIHRSAVAQAMRFLVERGLLVEEMGKNSMGRGMARQFEISPAFIQTLRLFKGDPIRHGK